MFGIGLATRLLGQHRQAGLRADDPALALLGDERGRGGIEQVEGLAAGMRTDVIVWRERNFQRRADGRVGDRHPRVGAADAGRLHRRHGSVRPPGLGRLLRSATASWNSPAATNRSQVRAAIEAGLGSAMADEPRSGPANADPCAPSRFEHPVRIGGIATAWRSAAISPSTPTSGWTTGVGIATFWSRSDGRWLFAHRRIKVDAFAAEA